MDISAKLKALRRDKGFSQEGLAETSGISIRTIQRIEKGLSVGSAFTLNSLAKALGVEAKKLISQEPSNQPLGSENTDLLKLLNLSTLSVVVIPLFNIIIPAIIFWKNRNQEAVNRYGRRVLSFQILWTLVTMMLMIVVPVVLLLLFKPLQGGGIPLAVPVYFVSVLLNICVTIRIALAMNRGSNIMETIPNIL